MPSRTSTFGSRAALRAASAARSGCGSTPMTWAADSAQRGRWNPVPQPMSRTVAPFQGRISARFASMTPARSTAEFSIS